jgi:hypothetical protein
MGICNFVIVFIPSKRNRVRYTRPGQCTCVSRRSLHLPTTPTFPYQPHEFLGRIFCSSRLLKFVSSPPAITNITQHIDCYYYPLPTGRLTFNSHRKGVKQSGSSFFFLPISWKILLHHTTPHSTTFFTRSLSFSLLYIFHPRRSTEIHTIALECFTYHIIYSCTTPRRDLFSEDPYSTCTLTEKHVPVCTLCSPHYLSPTYRPKADSTRKAQNKDNCGVSSEAEQANKPARKTWTSQFCEAHSLARVASEAEQRRKD